MYVCVSATEQEAHSVRTVSRMKKNTCMSVYWSQSRKHRPVPTGVDAAKRKITVGAQFKVSYIQLPQGGIYLCVDIGFRVLV